MGRPRKIRPEQDFASEGLAPTAVAEEPKKQKKVSKSEYTIEIDKDPNSKSDPFRLPNADPNFSYRFIRDDRNNITTKGSNLLFAGGGWQICPREHLLRIGIKEKELIDGMYRKNDTILAFMPRDLYKEKEAFKKKEAKERMDTINRLVKDGDPNNPDLKGLGHENMRGLQTAKALGFN